MDRRGFLVVSALLGSAVAVPPLAAHPHGELTNEQRGDIERQIAAFREAVKAAAAARDIPRLRALYAETFTHTHTTGQVDGRDARITQVAAADPVIELAPVTELTIRIHGSDLAVVSGRSPILNRRENRTVQVRWMQVMTRASGAWQLASSMAVRLPDAA